MYVEIFFTVCSPFFPNSIFGYFFMRSLRSHTTYVFLFFLILAHYLHFARISFFYLASRGIFFVGFLTSKIFFPSRILPFFMFPNFIVFVFCGFPKNLSSEKSNKHFPIIFREYGFV